MGATSESSAPPPPPPAAYPTPPPPPAASYSAPPPSHPNAPPPHGAPPPTATGYPAGQPPYVAPPPGQPPYGAPPPGHPPYGPPPPYGSYGAPPAYGPQPAYGTYAVYIQGPVVPGHFSQRPLPGLKIEPPRVHPMPGQVIIGYQAGEAEPGCCKCETLNPLGWIFVILWVLVFWPLAFIVCCLPGMHEMVQRPVYGNPNAQPPAPGPPQGPSTTVIIQ